MTEPTSLTDLQSTPAIYSSSRGLWEVMIGVDKALPIIEAVSSGDSIALQDLIAQPKWADILLEEQCAIYGVASLDNEPRKVYARPMSNLERAMTIGAGAGEATSVTTMLEFAKQRYLQMNEVIIRETLRDTIHCGQASVMRAIADAYPEIISCDWIGHGTLPLYEAVRLRKLEVVEVLLAHGADPFKPVCHGKTMHAYHSSLLSHAARYPGPAMMKILLARGLPIEGSGALHAAAVCGQLETADFLLERGADLNERIWEKQWTPMHFAAWRLVKEGMEYLVQKGADPELKDIDDQAPADVFENAERERAARESN